MLIVQIEHTSAIENLEEIVTIPGVDVALVGPNDLAISMGIPGQMEAPHCRPLSKERLRFAKHMAFTPLFI